MSNFIWPSDRDRADDDELNRVCEYLEEVLDERNALAASVVRLKNDHIEEVQRAVMQARQEWAREDKAALARLKARWQFEMLQDVVDRSPPDLDGEGWKYLMREIEELRRQAEEE